MRKIIAICVVALIMVAALGVTPVKASSSGISKKKAVLEVDAKLTLSISGESDTVKWKSDNKAVASVTGKGVVTAKSEGTAKITGTFSGKKYFCTVSVVDSNKDLNEDAQKKEAGKEQKSSVDYPRCEDFEADLNEGKDLTGKTVRFKKTY